MEKHLYLINKKQNVSITKNNITNRTLTNFRHSILTDLAETVHYHKTKIRRKQSIMSENGKECVTQM